jgi:hypothetical protein
MPDFLAPLRAAIRREIEKTDSPLLSDVEKAIHKELESLCLEGGISFGDNHSLSGLGLECRVERAFKELGLEISRGRDGMEDFVVSPPLGVTPAVPLAIEVKSSRKPHLGRDELRQLDDWVFELSGEQQARKHGLGGGGGPDHLAFVSWGLLSRQSKPVFHPTPHKGVLIFNGPLAAPFSQRTACCVAPNDEDFVYKRNFCVVPLNVLLAWSSPETGLRAGTDQIWTLIHSTAGVLSLSDIQQFGSR